MVIDGSEVMAEYLDIVSCGKPRKVRGELFKHKKNRTFNKNFEELVKTDLETMVSDFDLDLKEPMWRILLVQSVLGHAQMGHGKFRISHRERIQYPHATIPDIIKAAGMDVGKTKEQREKPIIMFENWVDLAISNKVRHFTFHGKPLMGANFLKAGEYKINNIEHALKGAALMGFVDQNSARQATLRQKRYEKNYGGANLILGGGETYLVDPDKLSKFGLDYDFIASHAHNREAIDCLRLLDIVVENGNVKGESSYIRRNNGAGVSDDLAFIMIGAKYGVDAMIGAFLVDAIDTYDKCIAFPAKKGRDEKVAEYIITAWKHETGRDLVTDDEIYEIIYHAAKKNVPSVSVSSSHRRLVQKTGEGKLYRPTILSHVAFVEGKPTGNFRVGFKSGLASNTFYKRAKNRINKMLKY